MRELVLCFVWPFMSRTEERGLYSGHSDKLAEEREEQYVALSLFLERRRGTGSFKTRGVDLLL